jgi:heavy metal translocating P-type ATPase
LANDAEYGSKLSWLVESIDFVTSVRINPLAESVVINYDASAVPIAQLKEQLFTAIQQADLAEVTLDSIPGKTEFRPEINWLERMGFPVLSLGLSLLATQMALPIPGVLIGGVIIAAAVPFFSKLIDTTVKEQRLDADILDALWISLYTLKGDFVPPALMISLMESGEALRDTTARASERQALDLLNELDRFAWVEQQGQERRIPLKEVREGDRVIVYPGELLPVSGRVLRGTALIDEHKLTGESTLVYRSEGQVVHASTLVLEGKLWILAKRIGKNTRVGVAFGLMQSAPVHDTRVEDYAAKIANATIVPTLMLSGTIFALTGNPSQALAPLHLDFSQGIRLAVPTTVLAALTYAARNGVYIRSGRALENLARTNAVIFDKTGTLTQGNAAVVDIYPVHQQVSILELLTLAASAEQGNTHPVASAIVRYAQEHGVPIQACETWDYRIGMGVVAHINGQRILVGSNRFLFSEGVDLNPIQSQYPELESGSKSVVYVARDGELLGVILYHDPERRESRSVVAALQGRNIDTYMLTGDRQRVANDVASKVGISLVNTYAEVFPDKKVEVVCRLQDQEKIVAFIGEGINDAAALAHADVSISFAGGSDLARETADVVLIDDDLRGLTQAIDIAKQAMEIVYQNTALVAIPNISVVLAGILFALDPILGVVISNGSAILAELNSFRPLFDVKKTPYAEVEQVTQPKPLAIAGSEAI